MQHDNRRSAVSAWHPDRLAARLPRLKARGRILAALRAWFAAQDFVEVDTPILQRAPGAEVHLKGFATELEAPDGARQTLWLQTSPEFAMKKLLAGGVPRLFQLAHVFRNGERSELHHPEFTMLEWYRAGQDYETLMRDCEALLRTAMQAVAADALRWQGHRCDPALPAERLSVADAFARDAGLDLLASVAPDGRTDTAMLVRAATGAGIRTHEGDGWDDVFFRIVFQCIEPRLGFGRPTILHDYPVSMAALSQRKAGDPRLAERFELYVCGVELANAFGELTDAVEQRARLAADMADKQRRYGTSWPIDEDFIAALAHGLPACSGIALGIDRLVMLATGAQRIEDVLWLPVAES